MPDFLNSPNFAHSSSIAVVWEKLSSPGLQGNCIWITQGDCQVLTGPICLNQHYQDERMLRIENTHPGNPEIRQILIQTIPCRRPGNSP